MSDLFAWWWTSGHPEGPGADLALQSPISAQARRAFDAGRAAERQRIRDGMDEAARWAFADLLDGDGDE